MRVPWAQALALSGFSPKREVRLPPVRQPLAPVTPATTQQMPKLPPAQPHKARQVIESASFNLPHDELRMVLMHLVSSDKIHVWRSRRVCTLDAEHVYTRVHSEAVHMCIHTCTCVQGCVHNLIIS